MNLGQFLTAKSPLPSGTVAQHLAAIAASVGTGTGETVFASMFSVSVEQPTVTVTHRAKRQAPEMVAPVRPVEPERATKNKAVSIFTATERITVLTAQDEITVTRSKQSVSMVTRPDSEMISRKPASTAINYVYPSINIVN